MQNIYQATAELTLPGKPADYTEMVKTHWINPVVLAYNFILNLGIKNAGSKNQEKYIRISNFIIVNTFVGSLIYTLCAVLWGNWQWLILVLPISFASLFALFMNGFGKVNLSRICFMLVTNVLVFINALYVGHVAETQNFFL